MRQGIYMYGTDRLRSDPARRRETTSAAPARRGAVCRAPQKGSHNVGGTSGIEWEKGLWSDLASRCYTREKLRAAPWDAWHAQGRGGRVGRGSG